jgi:thioredoxin-dependent peroxiredoxin
VIEKIKKTSDNGSKKRGFTMANVKLKGNPTAVEKEFLKVGSIAPNFTLIDQYLKECTLQDFGKRKKLLSIVPSLDTEVCLT